MSSLPLSPDGSTAVPLSQSLVDTVVSDIEAAARAAAEEQHVDFTLARESDTPLAAFDPCLRERLRQALRRQYGDIPELPTGAGHDAGILSGFVPTAMLFVRNVTGVSRSPLEHVGTSDCVTGVRALATVLRDLTGSGWGAAA